MHFKQIEIENFGTIGSVILQLADQGLVLVTGRNMDTPKADSNGAGKSLLLDAFCWCIWGRTIREDTGDDVVNRRIGKDCSVCVTVEESGKTFKIVRYRKHTESRKPNDLELFLNDTEISSSSMKTTQEVIHGIMGLTFETFCAMMPGSGKNAAQMTDADIKDLLENMLQITALAKARQETDRRLKVLRPEIAKQDHLIESIDNTRDLHQTNLNVYVDSDELYVENVQAQISVLESDVSKAALAVAETEVLLEAGKAATGEVERISLRRKGLSDSYGDCQSQVEAIESKFQLLIRNAQRSISETTGELKVRREELSRTMRLGSSCTSCSQEITLDHAATLQADAEHRSSILQDRIGNLETAVSDFRTEETEALSPLLSTQAELMGEIELYNEAISRLQPALESAKTAEAGYMVFVVNLENTKDSIVRVRNTENPYTDLIESTRNQIQVCEELILIAAVELKALQLKEQQLEFWRSAFSASGIRSFILDNVTPVLNDRANHYCDLLTDGEMSVNFSTKTLLKSGDTREKFSINIRQKHGGSSYRSNSTGERQRANLAICFALSDLAELHSSKRIDFRFLDEPFEGVDEAGTDAVVALLQEQREKYPTVFVVTHQSHFKEVFPQEITMVKQNGMSRLEGQDGDNDNAGLP